MRWTVPVVVVLAVLGTAVAGGTVTPASTQTPAVEPGEQFVGAIGAQHAEVSNAVETRALDRRLANATTPAERASVLAAETDRVAARLDALEARRDAVEDGDEDDDAGRIATVVAAATGLDDRLDRLETESAALPADLRERHNLTADRFGDLQERAADLHDADDEELARSIAGEDTGEDLDTEDDGDGDDDDGSGDGEDGDDSDGTDGTEDTESTTADEDGDGETETTDEDSDTADGDSSDDGSDSSTTTEEDTSDGDSGGTDSDGGDSSDGDGGDGG